ncbi:McrB family protein [Undibacterium sp. Rencai35W]|uniref:McrB family protein n=1 Tax=Undibacterium sp. Rencai35W TaxID=3413046 RepID=UPI003BF2255A
MAYSAWTKIDDGSEGAWAPDVWLGLIEAVARHEGERVYDNDAPIYAELEASLPALKWRDTDNGAFRPYFRDFSKAWAITGVVTFNETFQLTQIGRQIASGTLSARDCMVDFCESYTENGEQPFCILASGFLNAGKPLSVEEVFFGIETGYRPGVDKLADSLASAQSLIGSEIPGTPKRRLTLMLKILERSGGIINSGKIWRIWDKAILTRLASSKGNIEQGQDDDAKTSIDGIDLEFTASAKLANLALTPTLPRNFISSLLAKPFLILTGLSGSGKTKLAHAFAAWISASPDQYRIVAVGADWTSNENILGYQDALQAGRYCKPTTGTLDLILNAANDPSKPYFLILDEMNLSHVERYFSDILSAIESKQEIALHASLSALKSGDGDELGIPAKIKFPSNLFVIGTVNVDETTYMFSPKVLDRANVIEFRASSADISAFLKAPKAIELDALAGKGSPFAQAFVLGCTTQNAALSSLHSTITNGADFESQLNAKLVQIFDELAAIGGEFGFRTAIEISRFTYFHAYLTGPGWKLTDALDPQVLQKLLPKLHGSERRLGPVLKKLSEFCAANDCGHSLKKIGRMQERLKDGFTSFAEA